MSNQITPNPSVPSQVVQEVKFPQFVNNLGIIPTSYKDSMSYYETLTWLCKYLEETVIPTLNQNGNAVQELQGLYIELNSYVTNYFENLDVQEEINNKLDSMVEDGSLTEIITSYINPYITEQNNRISRIENKVNSVSSGSPAGVYATKSALESADPNHDHIYIVEADGYWYYYDTTENEWTRGTVYQATGIAENSVGYPELSGDLQNSVILKALQFYGNYGSLAESSNNAVGTQSGTGYYSITRNKPIGFSGKVRRIYIKVHAQGNKGLLKLERLSYSNNVLTKIAEDTNEYEITYGLNTIELITPFEVNYGEYLGFTITPTTESPYPVGYCGISAVYPTSAYNYGLLCKKYSDDGTLKLDTMIPVFDFEIESNNYINTIGEIEQSWLNSKSWIAYGDSITSGYLLPDHGTEPTNNNDVETYQKIIAEKNNMTFYNYGTSGRGYSNGDVENYKAYKIIESYNVPGCDIVTVAFGTNDWGTLNEQNNVPFGTTADNSTDTTFCAYVKKAFNMLLSIYPTSVIIIMTPIPRPGLENNNIAGHNLIDYAEAIKTIAKQYGFYIMDCLSISRSNVKSNTWRDSYMIDSVHMTESYHRKYYAPMVEEQLKLAKIDP